MSNKQKVVIIGHGYTSRLAVIRSVAQIGCEVTVIVITGYRRFCHKLNTSKPIDCYSKFVSHVHYCHAKDPEGLIQLLLRKCSDPEHKVIIIPDSDYSAAVIDQNQDKLKDLFLYPHIHHQIGAVVTWMDKLRQKKLAKDIGMNVASACVVEVKDRKYSIPASVNYPCFTKPLATIVGGKRIFKRCDNESQLCEILDVAGSIADMFVLIEDFKPIETEYAVLGFSDGQEVIIPGIIQILALTHNSHFGVASQGKVMPRDGFESLLTQFKQFILQIGYVGLFDIDFYKSDGTMYFCELNLRFGGSGYALTKMGVNLPGMMVKALQGEGIDSMSYEIKSSAVFVNERMCLDDWYLGYINTREFHRLIDTADIRFVDDADDPTPQYAFEDEFKKSRFWKPAMRVYLLIRKVVYKFSR